MNTDSGKMLLVGSVARPADGWTVEDVLRNCAKAVGPYVTMLPDGEIGDRFYWINFVAKNVYADCPDMESLSHHTKENWLPTGYADHWLFRVKPGVEKVYFPEIGYADEAKKSYAIFKRLKSEGVIPKDVRFQVALPLTESATRPFIDSVKGFTIIRDAYNEAMGREIEEICAAIPHDELSLQWDICVEVAAAEGLEGFTDEASYISQTPIQRYCDYLRLLSKDIPKDIWLGLHICYGSLSHHPGGGSESGHFCEVKDLNVSVEMANQGVRACHRPVQFIHLTVTRSRGMEDAYYEPLKKLQIGRAHTYLGLIHLEDGAEGALGRMAVAGKYLSKFGIATECGWGRYPIEVKVPDLLALHAEIGKALAN